MPEKTTYLNAASHGLPDEAVRERMRTHLRRESEAGPVVAVREAEDEIQSVRQKAGDLIGARPEQVALSQTTMSGWSAAVATLPLTGRRILVTPDEWGECAQALYRLGTPHGIRLEVMPTTPDGDIDIAGLKGSIDDDVAAISMPVVSSMRGKRLPVEDVGALPRPDNAFFIVDGAQALGQMPVDVESFRCDIFAATARKWLRSSRETAVLYVHPETLERIAPLPELNPSGEQIAAEPADVRRFESFDYLVLLRLALGVAIDVLNGRGLANTRDALLSHARHVRERVARAGLELASPAEPQSGITSFYIPATSAERISKQLAELDIIVKFPQSSNEPMRPPTPEDQALMRVSPHVYNEGSDIDALFDCIDSKL